MVLVLVNSKQKWLKCSRFAINQSLCTDEAKLKRRKHAWAGKKLKYLAIDENEN